MQEVKILGISGSPRINGNTTKLLMKALEGASGIVGVKTELYELAGKKIHHCTACFKCTETGECVFKDDLQDLKNRYLKADGIIIGAPVYHMSIPGSLKCALDRLGNSLLCKYSGEGKLLPMLNKVCGAIAVGMSRYGGQEITLEFLINSALVMNNIPVAGNTAQGDYIGSASYLTVKVPDNMTLKEKMSNKDMVLNDDKGIQSALRLGKRVAEMARIVKAGITALEKELPSEYFYTVEEV